MEHYLSPFQFGTMDSNLQFLHFTRSGGLVAMHHFLRKFSINILWLFFYRERRRKTKIVSIISQLKTPWSTSKMIFSQIASIANFHYQRKKCEEWRNISGKFHRVYNFGMTGTNTMVQWFLSHKNKQYESEITLACPYPPTSAFLFHLLVSALNRVY